MTSYLSFFEEGSVFWRILGFEYFYTLGEFDALMPRAIGFLRVVLFIGILALLVVHYVFNGIMVRNIGRKAGLVKDWMAFVPFARSVYRLQMINEQWWKLFFLEYWLLYYAGINWFFYMFNNRTMSTFGNVLSVMAILCHIAYNIYYRNKFYKAFGIKNELAVGIVTFWGIGFLTRVVDCVIAFTDLLNFRGAPEAQSLGQMMDPRVAPPVQRQPIGQYDAECSVTGLSGMYAGQTFPLAANDEMIIGRDSALSNIIIDRNADKVSRKHCGIRFDPSRSTYMVTDYSTNGTSIDGGNRLIANVPTPIMRGTVIALGNRENRFKLN
jgi:hypothetical protein